MGKRTGEQSGVSHALSAEGCVAVQSDVGMESLGRLGLLQGLGRTKEGVVLAVKWGTELEPYM